jgi:hypothetical protein
MAKIGVVTFSNTLDNYGQVLQYLAIQEYLKERGHDPYLLRQLDDKNQRSFVRKLLGRIKRIILINILRKKNPLQINNKYIDWQRNTEQNEKIHPRHFEEFRLRNLKIFEATIQTFKNNNDFEVFAVGSDQIWSYISKWYFLDFCGRGKKKIAIAPSLGRTRYSVENIKTIKDLIKNFSFITAREKSGVELCNAAKYANVKKILDPTLLLKSTVYEKFSVNERLNKNPYIFLYLLGADVDIKIDNIVNFAKSNQLEVCYVASQGRFDNFSKIYPTVPEWLSLMRDAKYVITNSFHGMAMSIIYRKQFIILPVLGEFERMNERIEDLASELNMQDRIYSESLEPINNPIDYSNIEKNLYINRRILDDLMITVDL